MVRAGKEAAFGIQSIHNPASDFTPRGDGKWWRSLREGTAAPRGRLVVAGGRRSFRRPLRPSLCQPPTSAGEALWTAPLSRTPKLPPWLPLAPSQKCAERREQRVGTEPPSLPTPPGTPPPLEQPPNALLPSADPHRAIFSAPNASASTLARNAGYAIFRIAVSPRPVPQLLYINVGEIRAGSKGSSAPCIDLPSGERV